MWLRLCTRTTTVSYTHLYRGVERVVRINEDVHTVEEHVLAAEREFGRPEGSTLLMAALESCKGVLNALEVCQSSERLIGIALDVYKRQDL